MLRMDKLALLVNQPIGIARRDVVLGALRRVVFAAAFVTASPQLAYADASDDYVACVIGKVVVNLHKGASNDDAMTKAWSACKPLSTGISENELEGISDFVYMIFERMDATPAQ